MGLFFLWLRKIISRKSILFFIKQKALHYNRRKGEVKYRVKNNHRGYTMLELLTVIIIMGLLIRIVVPQYMQYVDRAAIVTVCANEQILSSAVLAYAMTTNQHGTVTWPIGAEITSKPSAMSGITLYLIDETKVANYIKDLNDDIANYGLYLGVDGSIRVYHLSGITYTVS